MKLITINNILITIKNPFYPIFTLLPVMEILFFNKNPLEILCKCRFHQILPVYKPPKSQTFIKLNNVIQENIV